MMTEEKINEVNQEFEKLVYKEAKNRNLTITDKVSQRLNYEINVIENMKITEYFLRAYDLIQFTKKNNIYTGGVTLGYENCSLINYMLGITDINPLEYNLPFVRFINPQRQNVPEFLFGVQADKLNFVEEYLMSKYKDNNIKKDTYKFDETNYTRDEYFIDFSNQEIAKKVFLVVPMVNLKIIANVLNTLKEDKLKDIPLNDKKVFDLLNSKNELYTALKTGDEEFLKSFKPKNINDIALAYSLYRPLPLETGMTDAILKNKKNNLNAFNNGIFEDILQESYGIPVYQEQVMQILNRLFDISLGDADLLRRQLLKNKNDIFIAKKFNQKLGQNETTDKVIETLLNYSSAYFMKSAAIANAILIYKLCYLQVYYPEITSKYL